VGPFNKYAPYRLNPVSEKDVSATIIKVDKPDNRYIYYHLTVRVKDAVNSTSLTYDVAIVNINDQEEIERDVKQTMRDYIKTVNEKIAVDLAIQSILGRKFSL
jgi:hypothetical protein